MFSLAMIASLAVVPFACEDGPEGPDAGQTDGGLGADSGVDLGVKDAGPVDTGPGDTGVVDTGAQDLGSMDMGQGPGSFESRASLIGGALQETSVVALNGEVLVIGGFGTDLQFSGRVEAYNPDTDSWRLLPPVPANVHHANAEVAAGKLYILGYLGQGFGQVGTMFEYDPMTDAWTELGDMPAPRARGASAVVSMDGLIYVVGGFRNGVAVSMVDVFDPSDGSLMPLPALPRPSDHVVAGGYEGRIYVAGGREGGIGAHTPQVDILEVATGTWTLGTPMPTSRGGAMAAMIGPQLYVFGGEGNPGNPPTNLYNEVEVYHVLANTWRSLTPMNPPIHGTGAAAVNGLIYIPGGADVQAFGAVDQNQVFIP